MEVKTLLTLIAASLVTTGAVAASSHHDTHSVVDDSVIEQQRHNLKVNTEGKGFGPQAPRDIDSHIGTNAIRFGEAPAHSEMNLCNIHFHKNAEHKGGEFTHYAGNGNGKGYHTGFKYAGQLTKSESKPVEGNVCNGLQVGDTIELHYVHSSAQITPGPTLGACLSDAIKNPQLRVETQVFVLVNDDEAANFGQLTEVGQKNGYHQALNLPTNMGKPIVYAGSTTGPGYNEAGSPFQVTWSVRPKVMKVDAKSVGQWCENNPFNEDHAHGVRNLVTNPDLLSEISE